MPSILYIGTNQYDRSIQFLIYMYIYIYVILVQHWYARVHTGPVLIVQAQTGTNQKYLLVRTSITDLSSTYKYWWSKLRSIQTENTYRFGQVFQSMHKTFLLYSYNLPESIKVKLLFWIKKICLILGRNKVVLWDTST